MALSRELFVDPGRGLGHTEPVTGKRPDGNNQTLQ
jgi:hypothetical protein